MEKQTCVPPVLWAQRNDCLWLTICLQDIVDESLELKEDSLSFSCKIGPEKKSYALVMEFYASLKLTESKHYKTGRGILMCLKKSESGPYWPRLMKSAGKFSWLKTDFNKWQDEDASDDEETVAKDRGLEDMMSQMGGDFNVNADEDYNSDDMNGDDELDSDDEDIPNLE